MVLTSTNCELESYRQDLEKLGVKVVPRNEQHPYKEVTHLVANSLNPRTEKILFGIIHGQHIVTSQWVHASIKAGRLCDEERYMLSDKTNEARFGMDLKSALQRSRARKVFEGKTIFELGGLDIFKRLAMHAGAKVRSAADLDVERDGPLFARHEAFVVVHQKNQVENTIQPVVHEIVRRFGCRPFYTYTEEFILNTVSRQVLEIGKDFAFTMDVIHGVGDSSAAEDSSSGR